MKKQILKLSILLGLTIAIVSGACGQTPDSTTANSEQPAVTGKQSVTTDQTVSFLLDQNEKARQLIVAQEKRVKDLEAESAAERENGESVGRSYAAAQAEISALRSANESLHKAVALNEQTIAMIQSDRDRWKDKAKKEKSAKYKAYIVAAGVIALKFIIP